jgi:hypothetical protein
MLNRNILSLPQGPNGCFWSETYGRQLEDVFAMEDEISRSILDAVELKADRNFKRPSGSRLPTTFAWARLKCPHSV